MPKFSSKEQLQRVDEKNVDTQELASDIANMVTSSGTLTANKILTGNGTKTIQATSKEFETIPTNSDDKITTSKFLFQREGGAGNVNGYFKEAKITSDVVLTSGYVSATWKHCTGLSISLETGTWEVYVKVNIYVSRTANTSIDVGICLSDANNTSFDATFRAGWYSSNTEVDNARTLSFKAILVVGSTKTYYVNCLNNGAGTFNAMSVISSASATLGYSYLTAKRLC